MKEVFSSIFSLIFSSAAFYVFHLKGELTKTGAIEFDHYTFLYFITLVVVSLGFSLLFEMMRPPKNDYEIYKSVNTIDKIRYFFSTKLRYVNLLFKAMKTGLLRSTFQANKEVRGERLSIAFKNTLEKAGGIFIKFGQFLSTRSDLFSPSFLEELSTLQEKVSSVPVNQVKEVIHTKLGRPVEEVFKYFDEEPVAAASIAQVHTATLHSGEKVAVKVLRPRLKKQFAVDINILTNYSELLANQTAWARRIGIVRLTEGFIQNLHEEVDLSIELKNMQQMKKSSGQQVYVPKTFEEYSTTDVLVMEFLDGVSISKIDTAIQNKSKKQEIIYDIFEEMLDEIFVDGIFHGDPHPGNIFILANKTPAFIDFGSVGKLSTIQKEGFRWLMIGINRENADSMINGLKGLVENSEEVDEKKLKQALGQF